MKKTRYVKITQERLDQICCVVRELQKVIELCRNLFMVDWEADEERWEELQQLRVFLEGIRRP